MRRFALISDIHGNVVALDAALADIGSTGIEELYCLGDLVGYGPDPMAVIDRVRALEIPTVRGNYDEGIAERRGECGCYYRDQAARQAGEASYAFTSRAVDDEHAAWLGAFPPALRFEEAGVRLLLVHGSPRRVNEYLMPDRSPGFLVKLARAAEADVVCHGHIHIPYHRLVALPDTTVHYVSAGSVGRPADHDPRACWVEVTLGTAEEVRAYSDGDRAMGVAGTTDLWLGVWAHRVDYDIDSVQRRMIRAGLPATLAASLRSA